MIVLFGIILVFYWEDILAEIGDWMANFPSHRYTGALFFSLGVGGMVYWIVAVRKGWGAVAFMTFWFLLTFVGLFLGLALFTDAGVAAHTSMVENINLALQKGRMTDVMKVLVTTLLLPVAMFLFFTGGFVVLASFIVQVDPTKATSAIAPQVQTAAGKHKHKRFKTSNKRMSAKLGRK